MKRNNGLWRTLGIVFGCTLFFVAMIGAQSEHVRSPHPFSKQMPHGLKPWMGPPRHVFAGKPGRGIIWGKLALSEDQKAQMREQFLEFLFNSAEKWHESQIVQQDFLVEMRKSLDQILTPKQLEKLRIRRATARMWHKLRVGLWKLVLAPNAPDLKTFSQVETVIVKTNLLFEQERSEKFTQASVVLSPKQRLQQLQIFRL